MRYATSMNFCIPTFDFCAAGFPTCCQFDRLTEGFWPQNHKLLWPLTGGGRWPFIRGKIYRKTPRGEWKWPLMGGDRSSEVTVSGGSTVSPFEVEVVCTDFIGKMISHRRESNAIRSPLIMKHMYLLPSFAPSTASRSYKFLAEWGSVYWLAAYCISMPPLFTGAIHKKCCSQSYFAWAILVKQLQLTPFW